MYLRITTAGMAVGFETGIASVPLGGAAFTNGLLSQPIANMMTPSLSLIAILLGIVEGLTEFLPISSTGHLIVVQHFLKFEEMLGNADKAELFEVVIQLGAILAIGVIYRKRLTASLM